MIINNIQIDRHKLLSKSEVLEYLREYGGDDRALAHIRDFYYKTFGNELIWRYPVSDGKHLGLFIVIIREGVISLPYDAVDREDGELLELSDAAMFNADDIQYLIDDWRYFSDDLLRSMSDMQRSYAPNETCPETEPAI